MIICVDFDGTIVDHCYPEIGKPVPYALESIKFLIENNHKIILFTMRSGNTLNEAVKYLLDNGIELFGINENPEQHTWTESRKVYANMYIDDAAVGCPLIKPNKFNRECVNWDSIIKLIYKVT